jgi:hypothetical protein
MIGILNDIAKNCGTDKSSECHDYCDKYEKYLPFKRYDEINILEIGVLNGESLRMWGDYFYRSNVIGIDILPICKNHETDHIKIEIGSQTDKDFLGSVIKKYVSFDIIIDDGSHMNSDVIFSFKHLFNSLNSGGVYVIEDSSTSYWEEFGGGLSRKDSTMEYFKEIIDEVNFFGEHVDDKEKKYRSRKDDVLIDQFKRKGYKYIGVEIESINFLNSLIIITKR